MSSEHLRSVKVAGCGLWVPEDVITNIQLIQKYGLPSSDEWVRAHTGIVERHINSDPEIATSDMAVRAGDKALLDAGVRPDQIDGVIVATVTPDHQLSASAPIVKEKLGIKEAFGFDANAGCSGFVYALSLGAALIESGRNRNLLVIGADMLSTITDWHDRDTCFLFADGAGALVLSTSDKPSVPMTSYLGADGSNPSLLYTPSGGSRDPLTVDKLLAQDHTIHMNGRAIFRRAVMEMSGSIDKILAITGTTMAQVNWLVPHQANLVIIDTLIGIQKMDPSKAIINIQRFGNTSAASIPIALAEADQAGRLKPNDNVVTVAFGAGLTWGSMRFKWKEMEVAGRNNMQG